MDTTIPMETGTPTENPLRNFFAMLGRALMHPVRFFREDLPPDTMPENYYQVRKKIGDIRQTLREGKIKYSGLGKAAQERDVVAQGLVLVGHRRPFRSIGPL